MSTNGLYQPADRQTYSERYGISGRIGCTDPAAEMARRAGDVPPDPPEPDDAEQLRAELTTMRLAMLRILTLETQEVMGLAIVRKRTTDPYTSGVLDTTSKFRTKLRIELDALNASVCYAGQLAENVEVQK